MTQDTLEGLFVSELKDLYSAENQLTKALPKMAKAARCEELQQGFVDHLQKTQQHIERLKEIFKRLDKEPGGKKCKAMEGLIKEGAEVIEENKKESATLDAGLICAAQKVEHYEISGYGSVKAWAGLLGLTSEAALLNKTLEEEIETDSNLTKLATGHINKEALSGSNGSGDNGEETNGGDKHSTNRIKRTKNRMR